jgi:hypothetical protein
VLAAVAVAFASGAILGALSSSGPPPLPLPGIGRPARAEDPFSYIPGREADFVARATAGSAHVLFTKSPGGVLATAARVASFRSAIDDATAGTWIDPDLLEAIVFLESAGRPDVIAGSDPADAAGLTQILAQTGQSLLRMHIDLARSRKLTGQIIAAAARGQRARLARLERRRVAIDDRFNPRKALAAAVRYLQLARRDLGRADLAVVSYHMGIGNLQNVLSDYDGGAPVPYAQLYFDTAPDRHAAAYHLLAGFGDDSSLYYWRVLGAQQIMRLYRADPASLKRQSSLQTASDSSAEVLHPPEQTRVFADPAQLDIAYSNRTVLPLPSNARSLGLAYDAGMGSLAHTLGFSPALYRGLRAPALDLLIELAGRVRKLSGVAPLIVTNTVSDNRYQRLAGFDDPPAAAGWSFTIARRYVNEAQAVAFQSMLDRLQALNLIAWQRYPDEIEITVAGDAGKAIVNGP